MDLLGGLEAIRKRSWARILVGALVAAIALLYPILGMVLFLFLVPSIAGGGPLLTRWFPIVGAAVIYLYFHEGYAVFFPTILVVTGSVVGLERLGVERIGFDPHGEDVAELESRAVDRWGVTFLGTLAIVVWPGLIAFLFSSCPSTIGRESHCANHCTLERRAVFDSGTCDLNAFALKLHSPPTSMGEYNTLWDFSCYYWWPSVGYWNRSLGDRVRFLIERVGPHSLENGCVCERYFCKPGDREDCRLLRTDSLGRLDREYYDRYAPDDPKIWRVPKNR